MTLRTVTFAISFNESSNPIAQALICPDIKYVAVRWQTGRLDRRHVPAALWPELEAELACDLTAGPVSRSSMISTVLVGSMGALMVVSFVEATDLHVNGSQDAENVLDSATESRHALTR